MRLVYEADNHLVCQMLGNCFYGNIDTEKYDEDYCDDACNIDAMCYFLTHYEGKVISLFLSSGVPIINDALQLVCKSLERQLLLNKKFFHP